MLSILELEELTDETKSVLQTRRCKEHQLPFELNYHIPDKHNFDIKLYTLTQTKTHYLIHESTFPHNKTSLSFYRQSLRT